MVKMPFSPPTVHMERQEFAYCNECEDLVNFDIFEEIITEQYKGEEVRFKFNVGRCKCCGNEVATDIEYNSGRSEAKIKAYKKKIGIIDIMKDLFPQKNIQMFWLVF